MRRRYNEGIDFSALDVDGAVRKRILAREIYVFLSIFKNTRRSGENIKVYELAKEIQIRHFQHCFPFSGFEEMSAFLEELCDWRVKNKEYVDFSQSELEQFYNEGDVPEKELPLV